MARKEIISSPPLFGLQELIDQGYPVTAARNHPALKPTIFERQITPKKLIAQGYSPERAVQHPALNEEAALIPSDHSIVEGARLALAGAGIATKRPRGTEVTVNGSGVVMTPAEAANLHAVRQAGGTYSASNR